MFIDENYNRDESKRKLQEKLIQLLTELIQTERKYVKDLEQVTKHLLKAAKAAKKL